MRAASIADSNAPFAAEVQQNLSNLVAGRQPRPQRFALPANFPGLLS
jgi:hypothetical protein